MSTLPPMLTQQILADAVRSTWEGGELWKPPLGRRPDFAAWDAAKRRQRRRAWIDRGAALLAGVLVGGLLVSFAARAHQAPSGWSYDTDCCSHHDCAPVPDGTIRGAADGWHVALPPGSHPMLPPGGPGLEATVGYGDPKARISGDGRWHACVGPTTKALLCIYTLSGGV